jgi:hypothetical protein
MTDGIPWYAEPQWGVPMFVLFWFVLTGLLAHLGGWVSLSERHAANHAATGERFRFVSGSMGIRFVPVSYGNCLFVTVDARGVYLSILFPFRFMSPPLYLPWASFDEVTEGRFLLARYARMRVRGCWPWITLNGTAGRAALRAYQEWKSGSR